MANRFGTDIPIQAEDQLSAARFHVEQLGLAKPAGEEWLRCDPG